MICLAILQCFQFSGIADGRMQPVITGYSADRRAVGAAYAVPWAESVLDRESVLLREWQGRLEGMPYGDFSMADQMDWHLLRRHLASETAALALGRARLAEMEPLLGFRRPLQGLLTTQVQLGKIDPGSAAGVLAAAVADLKTLRKKLEEGKAKDAAAEALKPTPVLARRAAEAMDRLRQAMGDWYQFYHGFQPDFSWWVRQPQETLAKSLEETAGYLRKEIAGLKGEPDDPLIGDPIGASALAAQIEGEMIAYPAAELLRIAEREFAWCEAELKLAATAMGCQDGKVALARIKTQHAPPGGQAELAVGIARQAIKFLEDKELVTIPPLAAETWRMGMLGMEQQKNLPFAVYSDPKILVAYAHEGMSQEDKLMSMRGNNASIGKIEFANGFLDPKTNDRQITVRKLHEAGPSGIYPEDMNIYLVSGKFTFEPRLDTYPFDTQRFAINIQPKSSDAPFIIQPPPHRLRDKAVATDGWVPQDQYVGYDEDFVPTIDAWTFRQSIVPFYKASFVWIMKRQTTDYYLRVVVPLAFILAVAYMSIFIPLTHFEAVVTIQVTALLSAVALYLALPKLDADGTTMSDRIFLFIYMAVSLMIVLSILRVSRPVTQSPWVRASLGLMHTVLIPALVAAMMLYVHRASLGDAAGPIWPGLPSILTQSFG